MNKLWLDIAMEKSMTIDVKSKQLICEIGIKAYNRVYIGIESGNLIPFFKDNNIWSKLSRIYKKKQRKKENKYSL